MYLFICVCVCKCAGFIISKRMTSPSVVVVFFFEDGNRIRVPFFSALRVSGVCLMCVYVSVCVCESEVCGDLVQEREKESERETRR